MSNGKSSNVKPDNEKWNKIEEVFILTLEREPETRDGFLDLQCGDDESLRFEVQSLLEAHSHANSFIEVPAVAFASELFLNELNNQPAGEATGTDAPSIINQRIGNYQVERELGHGGMGVVYLARRADEQYENSVAIKVVRRGMDTDDIVRRFRNERQILAGLNHPNIARLYDGGATADGLPYIVMEYVEGTPVTDYCDRHRLTTTERLQLFRTIISAVGHAHQHSIVHRDLKPSNILITSDGTPKLLDFGIAKVLSTDAADDATIEHTRTEFRALTPDYASPEQVRGESLTTTSDIYSLGVVLYELLSGHRPYRATSHAPHELARVICEHEPVKPSTAVNHTEVLTRGETKSPTTITPEIVSHARDTQPDKLRRNLSGDLDNIVLVCLRKESARRYPSVEAFGEDIRLHLAELPIVARKDAPVYRTGKFIKRHRAAIAASVIVIAALCSGIIATNLYFNFNRNAASSTAATATPSGNVRTIAVLPLKSLSDAPLDQELRVGMTDSIVTKLSAVKQIAVRPTSSTVRYLDQNYDALAVGRLLQVDSVLEGSVQREANRLKINLQMVNIADGKLIWAESFTGDLSNVLRGQESVASRVAQMLAVNLDTMNNTTQSSPNLRAQEAFLKGNFALTASARNIADIFAARDFFERAIRFDPDFAQAYANLALTYTLAGSLNYLSPIESYPKAEKYARRALELDPDSALAHTALAEIESDYNWNWGASDASYRRALELAPNSAVAHHSYSEFLARMGRFDESAYHSDLAHQLDPTRINYEAVRALHYMYEHRFDDTIRQSTMVAEKDPNAYLAYLYLSVAHAIKGNYKEGLKAGEQAAAITGGASPDLFVRGCNYALANDTANTDAVIAKLQSMSRQQYVDPFLLVVIYTYRGDKDRAFQLMEKSYAEKSYWMSSIKVHPVVDSLRSDARFTAMLQKMNLHN